MACKLPHPSEHPTLVRFDITRSVYLISGTAVGVERVEDGTWSLVLFYAHSATRRWLERNDLFPSCFPTRRDALRAYAAASAFDPPPAFDDGFIVPLRCVRAGEYTYRNVTVRRYGKGERKWCIQYPGGQRVTSSSLLDAARMIGQRDPNRWYKTQASRGGPGSRDVLTARRLADVAAI